MLGPSSPCTAACATPACGAAAVLWEGMPQHIRSIAASLAFRTNNGKLKTTELVQRESTSKALGCSLQIVGCFYVVVLQHNFQDLTMYLKLNLKPISTNGVERWVKIWELEAHPTSLRGLGGGSSSRTQWAPAVAGVRPGQLRWSGSSDFLKYLLWPGCNFLP